MMMPVLDELRRETKGQLEVDLIDIFKCPLASERFSVRAIPTQIFYDATGKERFRHVGFISKQDILRKWKELGVELTGSTSRPENP
jgi:thioredoxin 1